MTDKSSEPARVSASMHAEARSFTDPLFVVDLFMATGLHERTPNGTATFVKYGGRVYALTCRHVVKDALENLTEGAKAPVLALTVGPSTIINMGNFQRINREHGGKPPVVSLFACPEPADSVDGEVDIAIACVDPVWELLVEKKQKTFIDLDNWTEPGWMDVASCGAVGYMTEHKSNTPDAIVTPMAFATVGLASILSSQTRTFRLHSDLAQPHGYWFSGMSGGPILALRSTTEYDVVGIIFEGRPSSPIAPESILAGPHDLFFVANLLTPETFASWLSLTKLPDLQPFIMHVVS